MERETILSDLNGVFKRVLNNPRVRLSETTTDQDIDDWESIAQIQVVDAIEKLYQIRFTTPEIQSRRSVSNLIDIIQQKLALTPQERL